MATPDPTTTDVLQTIFIGGQLAVLIAAAGFGWSQLREARDLREAQTRPFVVIDLDTTAHPFFDLVVKNIGPTLARNVRFVFEPRLKSTDKRREPYKLKMFSDGISTLPPGKEIRTLFDRGDARKRSDLPDLYEVTVTYTDETGKRPYEERIDIDFGLYWHRTEIDRKGMHDLHAELKRLRLEAQKWSASTGGGLLAVSPEDMKRRWREIEDEIGDEDEGEIGDEDE